MDATQEQTDVASFAVLEPIADGFRNYQKGKYTVPAEELLIDKAQLLTLTAPEMTVLVGGLRVLKTNAGGTDARRLHRAAGGADQRLLREPARHGHGVEAGLAGRRRVRRPRSQDRRPKWTGTRVDLVFGSNSQLRALAEVYGCADARRSSSSDFVAAWAR
jgi:catalase-peroxidase